MSLKKTAAGLLAATCLLSAPAGGSAQRSRNGAPLKYFWRNPDGKRCRQDARGAFLSAFLMIA